MIIWWLTFEKKPFQFCRVISIQVVVILLQLCLQDNVFGLFITHSFTNSSSCCIRFDDLGRDFGSFIIIFYRESAILTCWKLLQIVLVKGRLNSIAAPTPFRYTPSSSRHGSKNKAIQEKWFALYEYAALEFDSPKYVLRFCLRPVSHKNGILLPNLFWLWEKINFWNSRLKVENLQKFWDH